MFDYQSKLLAKSKWVKFRCSVVALLIYNNNISIHIVYILYYT